MSDHKPPPTTTDAGIAAPSDSHSLTVGPDGPILLQDHYVIQKMAQFNRERVPERVVHAKGAGAHGFFEVTQDMSQYTRADLFNGVGKTTPMFARFSTVAGELGSPDTAPRPARLRAEVLHAGGQLRPRRQQHAGLLRARSLELPGLHPLPEAPRRHRSPRQQHAVGLLDAEARVRPPGHDPHERPRDAEDDAPHERLRQPHVHVDQRRRREVLDQVPLQDRPGRRELHRRRGGRHGRRGSATTTAPTCGTRSRPATRRRGRSRSRSCRSRTRRTTASTRST